MPQTLFSRIERSAMEPVWQEAWDALQQLTGDSTFVEVFAQRPDLLEFVMRQFYGGLFFGGRVAQRYKQLARLQLSLLHGCRTCNRQNIPGALAAGFTPAQIDALIADDHTPFSAAERAVLRYARQIALTNSDGRMTPELYRELRAHFNEGELLELGTVMAVICGMAKLSFVLDLVEKEPYCPFAHAAA